MKPEVKHILYLGENGFPVGFAAIQRQKLIAKGLVAQGFELTVVSSKGTHQASQDFPTKGKVDGIQYIFTSDSIHKPANFWKRNWLKFKGKFNEFRYIISTKRKGDLYACLVSTRDIENLIAYRLLLKWLGVPMILDYCELYSTLNSRQQKSRWQKLNHILFDKLAPKYCDGLLPISEFLFRAANKITTSKPLLKVPILCDFERFNLPPKRTSTQQLLYCGSPAYFTVIEFVLKAFDQLDLANHQVKLSLVLGGGKASALQKVQDFVAQMKNKNYIEIRANLPDEAIPKMYAQASALLIPLRNTTQDTARFPHKVGEAMAAQCAIVTTAFGEILHYDFKDQINAFIVEKYDLSLFVQKLNFIIDQPELVVQVGQNGYDLAKKEFDYVNHGKNIKHFIKEFSKKT